jgi:hypothetical protein
MDAIQILLNINKALRHKNVTIGILREESLSDILPEYDSMLQEYLTLTEEERINLFNDVNEFRPVIGENLKSQWDIELPI